MFSKRPRPWDPAAGRPSDDQLMELLRGRLREIAPQVAAGSRVDQGILVGREPWAIMALPNHTGRPSHFDIGFVPSAREADTLPVADCISGTGEMRDAVEAMLQIWARTSGACFLAMLEPEGHHAARLDGSDPNGIAGWEAIVSDVSGYGKDQAGSEALQKALTERPVLREIAPALPREHNNGIKVYLDKTPTRTTGEIRVNGVLDVDASQKLAALPWPDVADATTARFYAVAVHRD